jgi:hypothetical protein
MNQATVAICCVVLGVQNVGVAVEWQEVESAVNPLTSFLMECEIPVLQRVCQWDDMESIDFRARATRKLKNTTSPRSLRNQILAILRAENPDEPHVKAYAADVKLRDEILRNGMVHMFVAKVDRLVGLTSKQVPVMIELGKDLHRMKKLPYPTTHGLGKVRLKDLAEVLTPKQQEAFTPAALNPESISQYLYLHPDPESAKAKTERRARMQQRLRIIAEMKSDWLSEELQLAKPQARRVALVAKFGISKAIAAQFDAQAKLRSANSAGRSIGFEVAEISSTDMISLYDAKAGWLDVVRGQLTGQERANLEAACTRLRKRRATAYAHFTLFNHEDGNQFRMQVGKPILGFTGEQQAAILKVVSDQLSKSMFANQWFASTHATNHLQTMDGPELIAVMGRANARAFTPPVKPASEEKE